MELVSLSLWLFVWNFSVEGSLMEAWFMQPLLKVKGVSRVGVKIESTNFVSEGVERIIEMEQAIEKRWTSI